MEWFTADHIQAVCLSIIAFLAFVHTIVLITPTKVDDDLEAKVTGIVKPLLEQVIAAVNKPTTPPSA